MRLRCLLPLALLLLLPASSASAGGVPPTEQGLLQGALTSSNTLMAVIAPLIANSLFAFFVGPDSPLGAALMGATVGDEVEVEAPSGSWKASVLAIRRA